MSDDIKVFEVAKEVGATNVEIINKAKELGLILKSAQSILHPELADDLVTYAITGNSHLLESNQNDLQKKGRLQQLIDEYTENQDINISSFPKIKIEITQLKAINFLEWELKNDKGIYVIAGENGAGKSSLLISLAKLVQPAILHHEFIGKGYENTIIKYTINGNEINYIKDPNWKQKSSDKFNTLKLNGHIESSILTGNRFKPIDYYIRNDLEIDIENDKISKAHDFIIENMNYILLGKKQEEESKFDSLYFIISKRKRLQIDEEDKKTYENKTYMYFALEQDKHFIKEYFLSTGEYFLLSLLKFLKKFQDKDNKVSSLIIIDEIELSLHPLAQKRLIERLKEFSKNFNLIVVFATHSMHIIEQVNPRNIYYISKTDEEHNIANPVSPGYLTTKLYNHQYYDKIILVEDTMAKNYLEMTIRDSKLYPSYATYQIIPIGGWEKVLDTALDNACQKYYGQAEVLIFLDDDKKEEYTKDKYVSLNCHHIPVHENMEKFIIDLLLNKSVDLISYINTFIQPKLYQELDIKINQPLKSKHIKNAFNALVTAMADSLQELNKQSIEREIVKYIYDITKSSAEHTTFVNKLNRFLNEDT